MKVSNLVWQLADCVLVVNVQDVVARRGKLWILYKRAGHRVIINARGDLIVRPSFAEANVQRVPGGGIKSFQNMKRC